MRSELSESQSIIRENALYYPREVDKMPLERRTRLVQYIIQRVFLIVVTTSDLEAAYRIFPSLTIEDWI